MDIDSEKEELLEKLRREKRVGYETLLQSEDSSLLQANPNLFPAIRRIVSLVDGEDRADVEVRALYTEPWRYYAIELFRRNRNSLFLFPLSNMSLSSIETAWPEISDCLNNLDGDDVITFE